MALKKICTLIMIGIICIVPTACSKASDKVDKKIAIQAQGVHVETVKSESINNLSELSGTLQPLDSVTVSFEAGGTINSVNVQEGSNVKSGDSLAAIDDKSYQLQLEQAKLSIEQASANLNQTLKGARGQQIAEVNLKLQQAETLYDQALKEFQRNEALYNSGVITLSDYEKVKNAMTLAEKDRDAAEQAYSLVAEGATEEQKQQADSVYKQALSAKAQAELMLSKTSLKSPIDGVVISKYVSQGQLVGSGTPAYKIGKLDKLKVTLPVPDYEIGSWKMGDNVSINLYQQARAGQVTRIFSITNENSGTINVEVTINNEKYDWYPGQVVICSHKTEAGKSIFIPKSSVINKGGEAPYVFTLNNGNKVTKTNVKIGELKDNKLQITEGLQEGVKVVIEGADRLLDGEQVNELGSDKK